MKRLPAVLLASLMAGPLLAQSAGRIEYTTYSLPNGLRVVLAPNRTTRGG